jgi:spermidine synthase
VNPLLELLLYQGRLQLATADALYSDGNNYRPVTATLNHLKSNLPDIKTVLALGTGLGSLPQIIKRRGYKPHFTLVEYDKVVLQWAMELLGDKNITPVCADAKLFMNRNKEHYDLVFIDIFNSRVVPDFVTTSSFFSQCQESLNPGGHVAFNYMIDDPLEWMRVQEVFSSVFPVNTIIDLGINRVFVGGLG